MLSTHIHMVPCKVGSIVNGVVTQGGGIGNELVCVRLGDPCACSTDRGSSVRAQGRGEQALAATAEGEINLHHP
jgi:hypothetical protein